MRVTWDTETHRIRQGLAAPPGVCLSHVTQDGDETTPPDLLLWRDAMEFMADNLRNPNILWCGHNVAYDFSVVAASDIRLLPAIFKAYEENRVVDTLIRDKLQLLAIGLLADENETGAKRMERFSLDAVVLRRFGHLMTQAERDGIVAEKKDKTAWRLRYRDQSRPARPT